MKWECTFAIEPQAKQSTRFTSKNGISFSYTPKKKREYQNQLATIAKANKPERLLGGALRLTARFYWAFPESWPKKKKVSQAKISRPDLDNLLKPLKDALKGVVYADDSQVSQYVDCSKSYSNYTMIEVVVEEIN